MSRRHLAALQRWDYYFDQGAAASVVEDTGKIRIIPRFDWNSQWLWWAIRSDKLGGKTPHFLIAKADRYSIPAANENLAVWAMTLDTDTWNKFDNQSVGASDIEFYNNAPFPNGPIYIAYLPIYPFSRNLRKFIEWKKQDARVSLVNVGQATARISTGGRINPGAPFLGCYITNASGYTKNNMILAAGNHPNENTGNFQLEGAVEWLMGGSAEAEFLLDWFNIYIFPCANPQGVIGGYFRSCPQDTTLDHNRQWATTGTLECIDAFKAAFPADVEVGIDFHSSADGGDGYMSSDDHTAGLYALWLAEMQAYDAGFGYSDAALTGALRTVLNSSYSAAMALSCEYGALNTDGISDWKTQGGYALRSVLNMHADGRWTNNPGVGSRSFNGTTDRIDWSAVFDLTGSPLTISAWVYSDGVPGSAEYIFEIHVSGDAALGMQFYLGAATSVYYQRGSGATSVYRGVSGVGSPSLSGAWHHMLITHDGTLTDYTTIHIYVDGIEWTTAVTNQNGSSVAAPTGSWSLGGRIYDDARNWGGDIAQVGVWNRVLTAGEITNLAAGYAPDLVDGGSNLKFYFKGNTSSLVNIVSGVTGTADGTTQVTGVGNGPSIIYG